VLIPGAQQDFAILPQVLDDIADFMGRKPGIDGYRQIVKPKLRFLVRCPHVNMGRFAPSLE
jgi:hypothetical protein